MSIDTATWRLKIDPRADATGWVQELFTSAIAQAISDIRLSLNRGQEVLYVHARVNRVMEEVQIARGQLAVEITNRIKTMSKIPTGPAQALADGLFTHDTGLSQHDLRVALFPTIEGETIAVRLPAKQEMPTLADIRFSALNLPRFAKLAGMANGLVLLAGPMGSGKSTTLYATLGHIGDSHQNVFTVEDPVERRVPGAVQIQINERSHTGWPEVLRGLRRSDLDILMIGEIRDTEQARAALEIGNAGVKVISSIHANNSVGAVHQLLELSQTTPRMLGNQLRGVVSQRLIRLLHPACKGSGCSDCDLSGYKGIQAIHEVLIVDDDLVEGLVRGASAGELGQIAVASGMRTLWDSAYELIAAGVTDLKEAIRVLGLEPDAVETPAPAGEHAETPAPAGEHAETPAPAVSAAPEQPAAESGVNAGEPLAPVAPDPATEHPAPASPAPEQDAPVPPIDTDPAQEERSHDRHVEPAPLRRRDVPGRTSPRPLPLPLPIPHGG